MDASRISIVAALVAAGAVSGCASSNPPDNAPDASRADITAAHFAVGAAKTLVTARPWWATGLEMTAVGVLEAAVTYGLGLAFAIVQAVFQMSAAIKM